MIFMRATFACEGSLFQYKYTMLNIFKYNQNSDSTHYVKIFMKFLEIGHEIVITNRNINR